MTFAQSPGAAALSAVYGGHVILSLHTVSEANQRGHWSKKAQRASQARTIVHLRRGAILALSRACAPPWTVTLTRIAPRRLDDDNLRSALKSVRDQVADELGLPNDRDPRVTWAYEQQRGSTKDGRLVKGYGVEIRVESRST